MGGWHKMARSLLAAALLAFAGAPAWAAEPTPAVTFGASVTNANGSLSTRLTWSTSPAADSCAATGHASWAGAKAASGALDMPAITMSGTYTLALECTWRGSTTARICLTAPTQYTDGSTIPAGALGPYRLYQGTTAAALAPVGTFAGPCTERTALPIGTHYFAATAVTLLGVESALSTVGSKVITADTTRTSAVTLTVNPVPRAPGATVE